MGDDTLEVSRQDRVQAAGPSPEAWVTLLPEARNDTATTKSASSHCLRQLPAAGRLGFAPAQPGHNAICALTVGRPGDRSEVMATARSSQGWPAAKYGPERCRRRELDYMPTNESDRGAAFRECDRPDGGMSASGA